MNSGKMSVQRASILLASMLVGSSLFGAADDSVTAASSNSTSTASVTAQSQDTEIAQLKAALAEQQKQLQSLQQALQNQQQLIDKVSGASSGTSSAPAQRNNLGNVASLTPVLPVPVPTPVSIAMPTPAPRPQGANAGGSNPCEAGPDGNAVPAYLRLGSVCIVPIGFMDLTPVWRDKNAGSSMGSNFGSIPYNNTANGNLSEFRFSIQNSRLGLRVDGDWKGVHFIGYNEFDFNGTSGSASLADSNGAVVPRLRLFWLDARKGAIEYLVGQSWSMLTPNRKGLSALPGDLFYTQVIDINYMAGLTWTRQPGMRILIHPNNTWTFGFSVEQPSQYMGGSAGGSATVLPVNLLGLQGTQLDAGLNLGACTNNTPAGATAITYSCSGQGYLAEPTVTPDFIAKIAWDPTSRFHFEVGGIETNFKTALNLTGSTVSISAPYNLHPTAIGAGLLFGANVEVFKNFRLITTNYITDGAGRYLFGQAPDLIVRADGSISPVKAGGTIDGFEATVKNTLFYGYYGGIFIDKNVAIDTNGKPVGYGYVGSANSQNRAINEITFGFNQTIWRNPRYGAVNVMGQYEWLERAPWYVAVGAPKNTHDNTIYFNVRYTLPGAMPNF
jgi:hypothetical protein